MKKKHWTQYLAVTAFLAATGLTQAGFAQMTGSNAPLSQQLSGSNMSSDQKNSLVSSRVDQITTQNLNGTLGGKLPSYLMDSGFIFEVDYLFWRADCQGFNYANLYNRQVNAAGILDSSVKPINTNFGFDSGFRVNVGYTFDNQDRWDLNFGYAYFHNSETDTTTVAAIPTVGFAPMTSGVYLQSGFANDLFGDYIQSATARWRLNYNIGDIELGRNFFIGRQLSIRPHWGLRGAWLYQNQSTNYTGYNMVDGTIDAPVLSALVATQLKSQSDFHGVGLRSGADMRWGFTEDWALVGSMSAALFYGRFVVRQDAVGVASVDDTGTTAPVIVRGRSGFNAVRPEIDASLGFEWSTFFYHDQFRVALTALWEVQEWFEQNVLPHSYGFLDTAVAPGGTAARAVANVQGDAFNGNLGIQGFTLKLRFDF